MTTTTTEQAQELARKGSIAEARAVLEAAASNGDASAAYSLAEIAAFEGAWDVVLAQLTTFAAGHDAVYAGNVKRDAAGLLWRAAESTGRWADAAALLAQLPERAVGGLFYRSLGTLFTAEGKGEAPTLAANPDSPEQRRAKHDRAKEKYGDNPKALFVSAAQDPEFDDDVIAHYPAAASALRFGDALKAAHALVRKGRIDDAWALTLAKLPEWAPVEACQIAPVELLWDPRLRSMITPARCAAALSRTPG